MSSLSREEMAQINGGDFTVYDCNMDNVGKTCARYFSDQTTVTLGTCYVESTTTSSGFDYSYVCK